MMMKLTVRMLPLTMMAGLMTASSCVTTTPESPAELAGCYYFERGSAADTLRLPWGIRLLTDSLDGWPAIQQLPDVRRAVTLVDGRQTAGHPFGYWRPLASDSVEVGYPAGGGLLLRLQAGPTHLTGSARAVGDVMPPGGTPARGDAAVSLLRAACP